MHHMFRAIRRILDEHPKCKAIYPIHMNPVVRQAADEELGDCKQIHIIEPIEVFDCLQYHSRGETVTHRVHISSYRDEL